LKKMNNSETYTNIYRNAVELLAKREHSSAELRAKLLRAHSRAQALRGQSDPELSSSDTPDSVLVVIDQVLERLAAQGQQSDTRFVESYWNGRIRKGYGYQRVLMELAQRGIKKTLVEEVLGNCEGQGAGEADTIYRLWEKKFNQVPDSLKERIKQQRFLRYRGFSGDEIARLFEFIER
jgi:regulatory protein